MLSVNPSRASAFFRKQTYDDADAERFQSLGGEIRRKSDELIDLFATLKTVEKSEQVVERSVGLLQKIVLRTSVEVRDSFGEDQK